MAVNKLERIEKDTEKIKDRITMLQRQLRGLGATKTEQENLQIVQFVWDLHMTPQEFVAFVQDSVLQAPPAPQPNFEQDEQEETADGE